MSLNLPETKEEMLKIVGVTHANYEKYGRDLLKITIKYAEERNKFSKYFVKNLQIITSKQNYHWICECWVQLYSIRMINVDHVY